MTTDAVMRQVAKRAPAHVDVGLSVYAWPKCGRCNAYGRFFDAAYLFTFLETHRTCKPVKIEVPHG